MGIGIGGSYEGCERELWRMFPWPGLQEQESGSALQGKEWSIVKIGRTHRSVRYAVGVSQALEWSTQGPRLVRLQCALGINSWCEALGACVRKGGTRVELRAHGALEPKAAPRLGTAGRRVYAHSRPPALRGQFDRVYSSTRICGGAFS